MNGLQKWSDVFSTEFTQYNYNLGNPDISGQENTLGLTDSNGEYAVIVVWKDGSRDDVNNIPTEFTYIVQELRGEEVYIQNIKLGLPQAITCSDWTLTDSANVGETVIAQSNNTNEYTYTEYTKLHHVEKNFKINGFSEEVFPYLGASDVQYSFNNLPFSVSNVYTPTVGGDLYVEVRVTDYLGNSSICNKTASIFYLVNSCFDTNTIRTGETLLVTSCAYGDVAQITSIYYIINGETLNGSDVQKIINIFGSIDVTQYISYFNGYTTVNLELNKLVPMINIAPVIDLQVEQTPINLDVAQIYEFSHNGTDVDGYVEFVQWEIWRNNPNSSGIENWSLFYTTGKVANLSNLIYDFTPIQGELKLVSTIYDNLGATDSAEYYIDMGCPPSTFTYFNNFDWSKKVTKINFDLVIIDASFNQKIEEYKWYTKDVVIDWTTKQNDVGFDEKIRKIYFDFKFCK